MYRHIQDVVMTVIKTLPSLVCIWQPGASSGEYCTLDLFVDFGTLYIVSLFTLYASPLVLSSLFPHLSFLLTIAPLHFQPEDHKRRPHLGFLVILVYIML